MSEVKPYTGNYIDENGTVHGDVKVYLSADFDRVTAERDALQERLNVADQKDDDQSLQLNDREGSRYSWLQAAQAAEKRVEVLEAQLTYAVDALNGVVKASAMYERPFEIATLAIGELSASAEPSTPCNLAKATVFVERLVYCAGTQQSVATGYLRDVLDVLKGNKTPTAPVERDERAELSAKIQQLSGFLRQALAALNPRGELAKAIKAALDNKSTEGASHE